MSINVSLSNIGSLIDATTAQAAINSNNATLTTALTKALSTDGEAPNHMNTDLDMNGFAISNLPTPVTATSPLRLQDLASFNASGTFTSIPAGGATHAILEKNSAANYDIDWTSTPTLGVATATSINKVTITAPATSATLTIPNGVTITGPATSDTMVGKATTDTLTNKSFDTAGTGNSLKVNGTLISATTGTGNLVLASSPTITLPNITGTTTANSATAGSVGEYIEAVLASGSATALVTGTAKTITSITLTAGDWDVSGNVSFLFPASTSITQMFGSVSLVTNTLDLTVGRSSGLSMAAVVPGATTVMSSVVPQCRFNVSGSTTIFLIGYAVFTASTLSAYGIIRARRVR